MKKVSIIGVGLIGGSLGLALKKLRKKYFVTGIGRNPVKLRAAWRLGAIDEYTTDFKDGVSAADIVVICLPVHLIAPTVNKILPFLKHGTVITDAGSVKGSVVKEVNKVLLTAYPLPLTPAFIGAHPMAGSEKSGVGAAKADLYKGASVVLIKGGGKKAFNAVKNMWMDAGSNVIEMTAEAHDRAVALISHLPHIIAFSLSNLAGGLARTVPELPKLAAGSFKDLTRVAGSNPSDWASICEANGADIGKALELFIKELKSAKGLLKNRGQLERKFAKAAIARDA